MSSPLDGRIRALAREEAAQAAREVGVLNTALDTQAMQQQITDLHEHLHHAATVISRLEDRINTLEKAAGGAGQEEAPSTPARRTRRKMGDE